jgi:hypothetical protein
MASTYWQKMAVERLYLRCCERYAIAAAGEGNLLQFGRFALEFREVLAIASRSSGRDVTRAALTDACTAFLGDEQGAEVR